jgi:hypothetical protein
MRFSVDTLTTSGAAKKLTFGQSPIITVIGKALWDVGYAPRKSETTVANTSRTTLFGKFIR